MKGRAIGSERTYHEVNVEDVGEVQTPPDVIVSYSPTTSLASNNMSDMLNLNCWLLGDDPRRVIPVEIAKTKTVGGLKKAIKGEKMHAFDGIDADLLDLWKVREIGASYANVDYLILCKVEIDLKKDQKLLKTIKVDSDIQGGEELEPEKLGELDLTEDESLLPVEKLFKVFVDAPAEGHLHIVVRRPPPAGECEWLSAFISVNDFSSYHKSTVRTTTRSQLFGAWG
jgi:hypothetical protein